MSNTLQRTQLQQASTSGTPPANPQPSASAPSGPPVVIGRITPESAAITTSGNQLLDGTNWSDWEVQMNILTGYCDVDKYIRGVIKCPDAQDNPVAANNWQHNDKYAMLILRRNISPPLLVYTNQCATSHEMWQILQAVFETKNEGTAMSGREGTSTR